jgi:hypothetical protein
MYHQSPYRQWLADTPHRVFFSADNGHWVKGWKCYGACHPGSSYIEPTVVREDRGGKVGTIRFKGLISTFIYRQR